MKKLMKLAQGLHVLYVEDNQEARESTLGLLENIFTHITIAVDGQEGLEKFQTKHFDLVLTDINMPRMNGIEMLAQIREINKNIPILILSAYNESGYFMETIRQGVEGYLLKPIDLNQFVSMLYKTIEKIYLKKEIELYQNNLEEKVKEQTMELSRQLYYDKLTSLENRNALIKILEEEEPFGLMLIDINNFSALNELYGSDAGDDILKNISKFLIDFAKERYGVFRVGGDQFAFLNISDEKFNFTEELVANISKLIENITFLINDEMVKINIAVTTAVVTRCESSKIFKNAQIALHHAKKTNQYTISYSEDLNLDKRYQKELEAVSLVKKALLEERIIPVFQKIEKDREYDTYECLVRIRDGENLISPFMFIDAVKRTRYYIELTKVMIEKSFEKFKGTNTHFSINLSFEDIKNKDLLSFLENKIKESKVENQLILEIVESESIENFKLVKSFTQRMQNLGVRISIDDFGSGYSNFSHILELNPDIIKIDGSLIKNICEENKSFIIVKTIIHFAKELGVETIVEFVHNKAVLEKTKELDVTGYQGYYIAEPLEII
ncbi:diguanylate cyclase/phosphodiesterase (GGDEF & EAL domains) with PAS/PAC sensor(s) [hydrothermal vent metagenome]|uniref:Diguanylate cyclase/phosphodiesterase (GGDEF & EAL domains) with PAS/PAC sensor(S) n=1 Tax=hydrothermal vent metagenome TaxID=652676 RepID=A0A1W1BF91_9ZZZZ